MKIVKYFPTILLSFYMLTNSSTLAFSPETQQAIAGSVNSSRLDWQDVTSPSASTHQSLMFKTPSITSTTDPQLLYQTIQLKKITIQGAKVIHESELEPLYQPLYGHTIKLSKIFSIIEEINHIYHQKGYVLSFGFLPPQTISDGRVSIAIVEVQIGDVFLSCENKKLMPALQPYLQTIKSLHDFNINSLQKSYWQLTSIPGTEHHFILHPGSKPKTTDLLIVSTVHKPLFTFGVDNHLSPYLSGYRPYLLANFYSTFRGGDESTFAIVNTLNHRFSSFFLKYRTPAAIPSSRLTVAAATSITQPGAALAPLSLDSRSQNFELQYQQNIREEDFFSWYFQIGYRHINSYTDALEQLIYIDRVRAIYLTEQFQHRLSNTTSVKNHFTLTQGLPIAGASRFNSQSSRSGSRGNFLKGFISSELEHAVTSNDIINTTLQLQYSQQILPSSEALSYGGSNFGAGFDDSQFVADSGLLGRLQWAHTFAHHPVQSYFYYDRALLWSPRQGTSSTNRTSAASLGIGLKGRSDSKIEIDISANQPKIQRSLAKPNRNTNFLFAVRMTL